MVSDPYSFDTDPDPIWFQGFYDQKLEKIYSWIFFFFLSKTTIYLSLGLHKGRPSYKRSLHLSKTDAQATGEAFSPQKITSSTSKHEISYFFLLLWVILPSSIQSCFRIRIRIH
jgi:hypothetical protein